MRKERRAATLPVAFFHQDASTVARGLVGAILETEFRDRRTSGRIVEVEAYLGAEDPASHAYRYRRHAHNGSLYLGPGTWYVYLSYGVHWCANLVAGPAGSGAAVLLRAIEPLEGQATMMRRRGQRSLSTLGSGPGRLCQALGITRERLDGQQMPGSLARVVARPGPVEDEILATPRIGITKAPDWPLRFVVRGSPWASGGRALNGEGKRKRGRVD
jgi:DNA-3-methyladenine glycosylase